MLQVSTRLPPPHTHTHPHTLWSYRFIAGRKVGASWREGQSKVPAWSRVERKIRHLKGVWLGVHGRKDKKRKLIRQSVWTWVLGSG